MQSAGARAVPIQYDLPRHELKRRQAFSHTAGRTLPYHLALIWSPLVYLLMILFSSFLDLPISSRS